MKDGWKTVTFGDIMSPAKVIRCGNRTDLPIMSITMRNGIIFQTDRFKKVIASTNTEDYKVVKNGQLVIAFPIDEGLIYTQDIAEEGIMSPAYNIYDVDYTNFDRNFLVYYFHSPFAMHYYKSKLRGTTQRRRMLSKEDLLALPIPIPTLLEQKRIVSELDLLSFITSKKQLQIEEFERLAKTIFYEMFGTPNDNEKEWDVLKLNEISILGTGATPSRTKEDLYFGGEFPWVKTTEVQNCDIYDTEEKITQAAIDETNCKIYPSNTLLMAMYGQGKTRGQIARLRVSAATNQACAAIQLNNTICDIDYLYQYLHIQYDSIRKMAQGGTQPNLSLKMVGSIPIIIPPISLQKEFVKRMQSIDIITKQIKQSIKEVETLFNSRMDYYFN